MKQVRRGRRLVRAVVVLAALAAASFVSGAWWLLGPGGWHIADGQVVAPYQLRHPDASGEIFQQDGQEYFEPAYGFMAENTNPTAGFSTPQVKNLTPTPVQCTGEALGEVIPEPGSWVVPSLSDGAGERGHGVFHGWVVF